MEPRVPSYAGLNPPLVKLGTARQMPTKNHSEGHPYLRNEDARKSMKTRAMMALLA